MKRCPQCGGTEFYVIAHVTQEWKVDKDGNFCDMMEDCIDVVHKPDDTDIWECAECRYEDRGKEFNVIA